MFEVIANRAKFENKQREEKRNRKRVSENGRTTKSDGQKEYIKKKTEKTKRNRVSDYY